MIEEIVRKAKPMPQEQYLQVALRFATVLLALSMLCDLLDPALLLIAGIDSLIYRAAEGLAPGATAIGRIFGCLAVLLLPFIALQFGAGQRHRRGITQLACLALALVGAMWFFLAYQALHLGMPVVPWIFIRNAGGALLFALALSLSLNREQVRNLMERAA